LPGTRSRPGTRCGRHSCPNSRQSPARVGLGTIDMGREARPGRYLRPSPNRLDPIDQTPSQSLLTATLGSWWVPFVRRAAFVLATTSSVRESTLVSSSGLLEFSLPSRKLPGVLGDLVQTTAGTWITHPPSRSPNGHTLGASEVLVGNQACLGHGGGHTAWTCRTCDETVYGPPLNIHCTCLDGPATVRISNST
jgi:hypothetical protein